MSATISTAPGPAAATLPIIQATLAGTGETGVGTQASAEAGQTGPFTALFQQLLDKQVAADATLNPGVLPAATATDTDPVELTDALQALLPFLEAMGLTQAASDPAVVADENTVEKSIAASPLAGLAAALVQPSANNPAISAAREPARNPGKGLTTGLPNLPAQASAAAEAFGTGARASASAAGEFSAQLATALSGAGERTILHLPGNPGGQPGLHPGQGAAAVPALPVAQTVGAPGWGQELGNRITWMASRMESRADLILTPPQMGRIEVSLTVSGDQASAIFTSANPVVREALEAAMPRLREMLADAGIQLGQAQVGAENARQSAQQEKNGDNFASEPGAATDAGPLQTIANASMAANGLKVGRGLVDVFA
ncbi:MAG: flagellar hook-length control protein FliK [Rhodocyclaceae bacterium]|nr:flagellar hook-length control protein FliK [Rhodocyclaceae bacterium]